MIVKQIKLSNHSKERLSRLKAKTGIKNWNVLCRWAFCYSIKENTIPGDIEILQDSNVEMSWETFAGEYGEVYTALMKAWCLNNKIPINHNNLSKYFKLHLERGINYLSGSGMIKSIDSLIELAIEN